MAARDDAEDMELEVLEKRLYDHEIPTRDHYALEVAAYWNQDLLDQIESGRRKWVTVGGYTGGRKADLIVELPNGTRQFTIARLDEHTALITVPKDALIAFKKDGGPTTRDVDKLPCRAPFPAYRVKIGFEDRLAYRLGPLTFSTRFVRSHGPARHRWDWLIPRWWPESVK